MKPLVESSNYALVPGERFRDLFHVEGDGCEKEYEMWFEGCRYFDIVRWGIAKQCYDKVLDNIPLQWDEYWTSGGTKPHKLVYKIHHPFADAGIKLQFVEGKNEYFPLPQGVLEVNPEMHQVRGWAN